MDYFLGYEDSQFENKPVITKWGNKISIQKIYKGDYSDIPERILLEIKSDPNTVFWDIITSPFLLISKKIKKVLELYEPNMKYKQVVLLDKKNGLVGEYYLPLLKSFDAIDQKRTVRNQFGIIQKLIIQKEKLGDTALFFINGVERHAGVWRQDILESIILRGVTGLKIEIIDN